MSRHRLTVVVSQAPGKHPAKRSLEESIVAALLVEPGVEVAVVPNLYDIDAQHSARLFLESVTGDMVVLAWHYPRAAFWVLDRDGIKGHFGESLLKPAEDVDEDDEGEEAEDETEARGIGALGVLDRHIYCVDLRNAPKHEPFLEEIRRIAAECRERRAAQPQPPQPAAVVSLGTDLIKATPSTNGNGTASHIKPEELLQAPNRRWYPVIDYSRCTNCLECIDFCLFGVYGIDGEERITVENQDQCRKGCPACSRVCPEQAIIFPEHKTPAIAGAPVGAIGALKIDLSRLFGGDEGSDALHQAVAERDRELVADGRDAVGMAVGIPKRQQGKGQQPRDDLDTLMDALDDLDI
jgi:NAD-dependent dihydropyrimidine dehydrogenase PreA subunit